MVRLLTTRDELSASGAAPACRKRATYARCDLDVIALCGGGGSCIFQRHCLPCNDSAWFAPFTRAHACKGARRRPLCSQGRRSECHHAHVANHHVVAGECEQALVQEVEEQRLQVAACTAKGGEGSEAAELHARPARDPVLQSNMNDLARPRTVRVNVPTAGGVDLNGVRLCHVTEHGQGALGESVRQAVAPCNSEGVLKPCKLHSARISMVSNVTQHRWLTCVELYVSCVVEILVLSIFSVDRAGVRGR